MSVTLILPDSDTPMTEPGEIRDRLGHAVDLVIDGGTCTVEPTTVVDLTDQVPEVVRVGRGDPAPFQTE